ncbi:MAG: hypothetical protein HY290_10530 [Planctomycetia bacterium]|nr:hypothetical protein [Planctomycetia bacterium]
MAVTEPIPDSAKTRISTQSSRILWTGLALVVFALVGIGFHTWHHVPQEDQTQPVFPSVPTREYRVVGGHLSAADVAEIESLVSKLTEERILLITVRKSGSVTVTTGVVRGPLDGGGSEFDFEKENGRWVKTGISSSWVSDLSDHNSEAMASG